MLNTEQQAKRTPSPIAILILAAMIAAGIATSTLVLTNPTALASSQLPTEAASNARTAALLSNLVNGWNFVSLSDGDCEPAGERLPGMVTLDSLRVAAVFSAANQNWLLYDPSAPSYVNSLQTLCQGDILALYVARHDGPTYTGSLSVGKAVKAANLDGGCLYSRSAPAGEALECLPEGYYATVDNGPTYVDGRWWWHLAGHGWSADDYLVLSDGGSTGGTGRINFYNCEGPGGGYCGATATGSQVAFGQASCDNSRLGQKFDLAGITFTCTDTGNGVHGNDVDLFFQTYDDGVAFIAALSPNAHVVWLA